MISCSVVYCLLVIFCVITHLHIGEIRLELLCHQFCVSPSAFWGSSLWKVPKYIGFLGISLFPVYNLILQHKGYWIKIWIFAVFFNQRYELEPKAVISTCSQVVSIMLSWELSNSSDTPFCVMLKGTEIAFQVYLLLEYVGVSWKGPNFCCRPGNL